MILQSLNELYTRLADDAAYEIAPPGFSPQKISLRLVIKLDGTLVDPQDARLPDKKNGSSAKSVGELRLWEFSKRMEKSDL